MSWSKAELSLPNEQSSKPSTPRAPEYAHRAFSEAELLVVLAAVWGASLLAWSAPLSVGVGLVVAAFAIRRRWLLAFGLVWLASGLASNADQAYAAAVSSGLVSEPMVVVSDVESTGFGSLVVAKLADGRRVEVVGYGLQGRQLSDLSVGGSATVDGYLRPIVDKPWLRTRHIVGRVSANAVSNAQVPPLWRRPPEVLRSLVLDGARVFSPEDQALYAGLVIGDDRQQSAAQRAHFRAAALTHLLAVSGQNVAFVLTAISPLLLRLRRMWRWPLIVIALIIFASATRLEPSVLRATLSVGLATTLALLGLRTSGLRIICLASIGLLFVDPFLARSVGFQLSVAASLGILILAPTLEKCRRLPSVIWTPLSITVAAQVGVAPILVYVFGQLPLASIPANILAGWAAGFIMVWGLTVGIVSGFMPEPVAVVLQAPASALLWWLRLVASTASSWPLPVLGPISLWVSSALAASLAAVWRFSILRIVMAVLLSIQLVALVPKSPVLIQDIGSAVFVPASAGSPSVLIVRPGGSNAPVFWLVERRIRKVDIVVFERGDRRANEQAKSLRQVTQIDTMLAPSQHRIVGARRVTVPMTIKTGSGGIELFDEGTQLQITVPTPKP